MRWRPHVAEKRKEGKPGSAERQKATPAFAYRDSKAATLFKAPEIEGSRWNTAAEHSFLSSSPCHALLSHFLLSEEMCRKGRSNTCCLTLFFFVTGFVRHVSVYD